MELVLVRHAEPIRIGPEESGGEAVDPELTRRGYDQAVRLGAWLGVEPVHHVVSSPLRRAVETAQPVADAHRLEVEVVDGLQEWDANADHYIPMEELREAKDDRWAAMVEGRWEDYGGENPERFRARIVPAIDGIIDAHPGETVVVVCHGGVINVYLAALLGLPHHLWFDPGYTSISRVRAARAGARSLASLNEMAHLYATREALG
ncbi:MAG: histidine phosphatase family protein [Acidimicrobiia bacterium]